MDSIRTAALPPGLTGLTDEQALERRSTSAERPIAAPRATLPRTLVRQFASPFDALLLGVAMLSIALHQATDATIVLAIVAASVALGTRNEYRAERIIEDLRARVSDRATVVRSGTPKRIDARDLVMGDVVALTVGDVVPADLEIRHARNVECDESMLTGEGRPVEKPVGSNAYMGTTVSSGAGYGVVVALGARTRFGEIASHAARAAPPGAFEIGLRRFSTMLLVITVVLSTTVFIVSLALHRSAAEALLFALAISVSLAPQMLPVIVSV